jgi:hypothetical protein
LSRGIAAEPLSLPFNLDFLAPFQKALSQTGLQWDLLATYYMDE